MSQGMVSCRPDVDFGVDFLSGAGDLKLKHKIVSGPGWRLGDSNGLVHNNKKRKKKSLWPPRIYLEMKIQGHERPGLR